MEMVVADDAIYVMDRGYIVYKNYKAWAESGIRFVARIQQRNKTQVIRERDVPESSTIQRDADVMVTFVEKGKEVQVELRLVEFLDEKGRPYRVLTDVHDLSAEQISEVYRHRWMIELFFKWIKQHLKLVKLHSVEPDAVWSQMYLALIAYCLVLLIKLETGTNRTPWQVLKLLRLYANDSWQDFLSALFRRPTRTSQGRRKKAKMGRPRKNPPKLKGKRLIVK
jgi:IS4 transposase